MSIDNKLGYPIEMYFFNQKGGCYYYHNLGEVLSNNNDPQLISGMIMALMEFSNTIGLGKNSDGTLNNKMTVNRYPDELRITYGNRVNSAMKISNLKNLNQDTYDQLDGLMNNVVKTMESGYSKEINEFNQNGTVSFKNLDSIIDNEVIKIKESMYTFYIKTILLNLMMKINNQNISGRLQYYNTIDTKTIEDQHAYNNSTKSFLEKLYNENTDVMSIINEINNKSIDVWCLFKAPIIKQKPSSFDLFK